MKDRNKWYAATVLIVAGGALIAWNLRDSDRGKPAEDEPELTINDVPAPVKATLQREGAGGTLKDVEKKSADGKTVYEASIVLSGRKVELEIAEDGSVLERSVKAKKL